MIKASKNKWFLKFLLTLMDDVLIVFLLIIVLLYLNIFSIWVNISLVMIVIGVLVFTTYIFLPQFKKPVIGPETLVNSTGFVVEKLNPRGRVNINGEIWAAISLGGCVEEGEKILVEKIDGNKLIVKKKLREKRDETQKQTWFLFRKHLQF